MRLSRSRAQSCIALHGYRPPVPQSSCPTICTETQISKCIITSNSSPATHPRANSQLLLGCKSPLPAETSEDVHGGSGLDSGFQVGHEVLPPLQIQTASISRGGWIAPLGILKEARNNTSKFYLKQWGCLATPHPEIR